MFALNEAETWALNNSYHWKKNAIALIAVVIQRYVQYECNDRRLEMLILLTYWGSYYSFSYNSALELYIQNSQ